MLYRKRWEACDEFITGEKLNFIHNNRSVNIYTELYFSTFRTGTDHKCAGFDEDTKQWFHFLFTELMIHPKRQFFNSYQNYKPCTLWPNTSAARNWSYICSLIVDKNDSDVLAWIWSVPHQRPMGWRLGLQLLGGKWIIRALISDSLHDLYKTWPQLKIK